MGFVDVADVARAHIVGMENVAAGGSRYLCCAPAMLWADVAALLHEVCPSYPNTAAAAAEDPRKTWTMDTSRIQALGMSFKPAAEAIKAQVASVVAQFPEAARGLDAAAAKAEGKRFRDRQLSVMYLHYFLGATQQLAPFTQRPELLLTMREHGKHLSPRFRLTQTVAANSVLRQRHRQGRNDDVHNVVIRRRLRVPDQSNPGQALRWYY